jgi:hypothetical protein
MGGITSALNEIGHFFNSGTVSAADLGGIRGDLDRYYNALHRARAALEACVEPEAGALDRHLLTAALEDLCCQRRGLANCLQHLLVHGYRPQTQAEGRHPDA